jgi:replicative DNA helicase
MLNNLTCSIDAEEGVLASCMYGGAETYDALSLTIAPEDFSQFRNRLIFEAMGKLVHSGQGVDEISIMGELGPNIAEVGGIDELIRIQSRVHSAANAKHYAETVLEKSRIRTLLRSYHSAISQLEDGEMKPEDIHAGVERSLAHFEGRTDQVQKMAVSCEEIGEEFASMDAGTFVADAIPTGQFEIDQKLDLGGIGKGEVFTLAAPTSCGKTAFAMNVARHSAEDHDKPVGIFSFEMPQKQLAKRLIQMISGVNVKRVREGVCGPIDRQKIEDAKDKLASLPVYTSHRVRNVEDLATQARVMVRKHGVELLVIDYLQLVPTGKANSKAEGVSNVSHAIKQLAIELNVAVILLSQVNREGAKRESGITLYDLKETGDIENDADVILLLWPAEDTAEESKVLSGSGPYTLVRYCIAKNREGERNVFGSLRFFHLVGRFGDTALAPMKKDAFAL